MPTDEPLEPSAAVVQKLMKQHGGRLRGDESIIAACRGGAIDRVEPGTVFGLLGPVGRRMEQSLGEDTITRRTSQVKLFLHRKGLTLIDFVETKDGYSLGLTQERVLVFNSSGRRFLGESPVRDMRLEQVAHDNDVSTLFFCEGREAAAVTSWEDAEVTTAFVAAYRSVHATAMHRQAS